MFEEEQRLGVLASYSNVTVQSMSSLLSLLRWSAESEAELEHLERKIISHIQQPIQSRYVHISATSAIWTLCINSSGPHSNSTSPLVLLHGLGMGAALWALNIDELAATRPVYVIDLLGFGRSSRVPFSSDPAVAECEMAEALELWRQEVGLDKFILLGHCFGGFLATAYTLRNPDNIRHLILVDPWGFPDSKAPRQEAPLPLWVKMILLTAQPFNPLALLRLAGVWGPMLVERFKPDLIQKYSGMFTDDTIAQYIYQCNAPNPTGETAFKHMSQDFGWAVYPMINRVKDIPVYVSMTTIFGSRSYIDTTLGQQIKDLRPESYVDVQIIRGAGHYLFADKAEVFNGIITTTCTLVDHRHDALQPLSRDRRRRRLKSDSEPNLQALTRRAPRQAASSGLMGRRSRHNSDDCLVEEEGEGMEEGMSGDGDETVPASDMGQGFQGATFDFSDEGE